MVTIHDINSTTYFANLAIELKTEFTKIIFELLCAYNGSRIDQHNSSYYNMQKLSNYLK